MIRLALPLDPADRKTLGLSCPVIVCDRCGEFIDNERPGNLLWHWDRPEQYHVHKACDGNLHHALPMSRDIDEWLAQLVHNYEHPIQKPGGVEVTLSTGSAYRVRDWCLEGSGGR